MISSSPVNLIAAVNNFCMVSVRFSWLLYIVCLMYFGMCYRITHNPITISAAQFVHHTTLGGHGYGQRTCTLMPQRGLCTEKEEEEALPCLPVCRTGRYHEVP